LLFSRDLAQSRAVSDEAPLWPSLVAIAIAAATAATTTADTAYATAVQVTLHAITGVSLDFRNGPGVSRVSIQAPSAVSAAVAIASATATATA
jgi:hypothetical protein